MRLKKVTSEIGTFFVQENLEEPAVVAEGETFAQLMRLALPETFHVVR